MNSIKYIIIPFCVAILSQIIKVIIEFIKYKKISIRKLFDGMGGMPSTHCALVSSLTTLMYLDYNLSTYFSITLVFSLVIIYDSMGIRYESGQQAKVLNKVANTNLKERLGHKPIEVLIGVFFGTIMSIIINS